MNRISSIALFLILLSGPAAVAAPDSFYQNLLREGLQDYDRGNFAAASQTLRIACFGMLDDPLALAGCLSRLALAQDRAEDGDGFQETFRRIVEVEERFQAYSKAELPAEIRSALEQRLAARIPAATLRSIPSFQRLASLKAQGAPGKEPKRRAETSGEASPDKPKTVSPPPPQAKTPAGTGSNGVAIAAGPAAPAEITAQEREKMAQARRLLDQDSKIKELRQAFDLARQIADAHTASVEAQHLAAEAAYRISRWEDAARYFRRGGEPAADKPELQFYMAVALFEAGEAQAAAAILKRSLPNLQRTPYVDAYARKILG
jgi:tetratricopeptide (TPR) repeat protein